MEQNTRYQILEEINQGGVGVVFKALDQQENRVVALKRVLPHEQQTVGEVTWEDFRREAATLSRVNHPNIVGFYGLEECPQNGPQVVMEYLNGMDLERAAATSAMTLGDFLRVAVQSLSGLDSAHGHQLLHRDIKPANLQVTWRPDGKFDTKIVDFGLARYLLAPSKQTVRIDGSVVGSVYFMAPEQLDRQPLDQRTDLYSLGCVFYYILTTHRPFTGSTVYEVMDHHLYGLPVPLDSYRPDLPSELGLWLARLMSRRAADRPASAAEALLELRGYMEGIHDMIEDPVQPQSAVHKPVATKFPAPLPSQVVTAPVGLDLKARRPARHKPSAMPFLWGSAVAAAAVALLAFSMRDIPDTHLSHIPLASAPVAEKAPVKKSVIASLADEVPTITLGEVVEPISPESPRVSSVPVALQAAVPDLVEASLEVGGESEGPIMIRRALPAYEEETVVTGTKPSRTSPTIAAPPVVR